MALLLHLWNGLAVPLGSWFAARAKSEIELVCISIVFFVGLVDLFLGSAITVAAGYIVPVSMAAWFVSMRFAFLVAGLSTLAWLLNNYAAGQGSPVVVFSITNGLIRMVFYTFLIFVLVRLNRLQKGLEARAEERAQSLAREIAERQRLEQDMLAISEREQRRIGQDLHDGLCQHLTGTALTGHVLAERLAVGNRPEQADARKIVGLVEEAIGLARGMAKGLHPVELESDGLMQALEEFAYTTSEMFAVRCMFECQTPVLIGMPAAATHLYRIAQEGVGNAIKHGRASEIVILLEESESAVRLAVLDNGTGISNIKPNGGMGLRIMAGRAKMIGGTFSVGRSQQGGTALNCFVPLECFSLDGANA
jgi:signal transduction histidine kinase